MAYSPSWSGFSTPQNSTSSGGIDIQALLAKLFGGNSTAAPTMAKDQPDSETFKSNGNLPVSAGDSYIPTAMADMRRTQAAADAAKLTTSSPAPNPTAASYYYQKNILAPENAPVASAAPQNSGDMSLTPPMSLSDIPSPDKSWVGGQTDMPAMPPAEAPKPSYSSTGVPKPTAAPNITPSVATAPDTASMQNPVGTKPNDSLPPLAGIIGNWHNLSEQQKDNALLHMGINLGSNSRGNSFAAALAKSAGGYEAERTSDAATATAQANKERELGQKDTENVNTLALKTATLGTVETPTEKRRRANMDDARQFAATRDMLGNVVVDPIKMNKYLVSVGEQPINVGDPAATAAPADKPSWISKMFGGGDSAPAPSSAPASIPPAGQRVVGQAYQTPKGMLKWTGTGWSQ